MRVDSSAHRSSSARVAGGDAGEHVGVQRELRERPAERGEQVGHRRDVQQHDVTGDALRALRARRCRTSGARSRRGSRPDRGRGRPSSSPTATSKRASAARSACLSADATAGIRVRVHERVGAVELVELGDEPVEPRAAPRRDRRSSTRGRAGGRPGGRSRTRRSCPCVPELGQLEIERVVEVAEIRLDVLGAEQIVRHRAHTGEQLLRAACARACGSRRGPCSRRARGACRTRGAPSGENTKR